METLFLKALNMSLTASYAILIVLVVRLALRKAPKVFSYALWSVVLFRLLCPVSFEGLFTLMPLHAEPIPGDIVYAEIPRIDSGVRLVDNIANPILEMQKAAPYASINPMQITVALGGFLWVTGAVALLLYSALSFIRLRSSLVGAVRLRDNIFMADRIASPFVVGLLRPRIYLPSTLSEQEQSYIVLHEQTHIRRFDPLIKALAFAALVVHWFNPLVWLAFALLCKDMELSCDEAVVKQLDMDGRKSYSASLLRLAAGKTSFAGGPIAFGEGETTSRIKHVLRYKRPSLPMVGAALLVVCAVCLGLASNGYTQAAPAVATDEAGDIRIVSGSSSIRTIAFDAVPDLLAARDSVPYLSLENGDDYTPFRVYEDGREQYGHYSLYDAESLQPIAVLHPSGLEPQTYLLAGTESGQRYLVVLSRGEWSADGTEPSGNDVVFGIRTP